MTARERPEQRSTFVLTLRGEGPDVIHRLRRALKYLGRVCHLRAISVELHPDRPDDPTTTRRT
jgi:hypothetical protein